MLLYETRKFTVYSFYPLESPEREQQTVVGAGIRERLPENGLDAGKCTRRGDAAEFLWE